MMTTTTSEPLQLRGMTWDHPRGIDGLVGSAAVLQEETQLSVTWEARSLLNFGDQHIADFAKNFDLMVIDHPHVPDAVEAGALLPLDEYLSTETLAQLRRESVGRSHDSYNVHGKQWGLAIDAAAQVSAFRPDLCDGVPLFWSDVLEDAHHGRVLWPYKPVDAFSTFSSLLAQHGHPLADKDQFLHRDSAVSALTIMIELAAHVPDWCASANPIDVAESLSADDGQDFSYAVALFGYTNYSIPGFRPHRLVYDDLPSLDGRAGGSTLGGAGIAVSAHTRHPERAAAAAAMLAGAEIQSGPYTWSGGQPGNLRAWKSAALGEHTAGFFANTLRTLERAWVRPPVLGWPDLQLELSHIVHKALIDRKFGADNLDTIETLPERFLK